LASVQPRLDLPVLDAERRRLGRLRRTALPVPLHLARQQERRRLVRQMFAEGLIDELAETDSPQLLIIGLATLAGDGRDQ
jgi:hypothetical protein